MDASRRKKKWTLSKAARNRRIHHWVVHRDKTRREIAAKYGISPTRVTQIVNKIERENERISRELDERIERWREEREARPRWPPPEQHDRHCYMLVDGFSAKITGIERPSDEVIIIHVTPPKSVKLLNPDWGPYCEAALDLFMWRESRC